MENHKEIIRIKYHPNSNGETVYPVTINPKGDWIDLRISEDLIIKQGESKLVPLGVSMSLPEGYEAHLTARSSTFTKYGLIFGNSIGIIDNAYKGDQDIWRAPFYATRDVTIPFDTRLCQFRIVKNQPSIEFEEVDHLDENNRDGFGSTGEKEFI